MKITSNCHTVSLTQICLVGVASSSKYEVNKRKQNKTTLASVRDLSKVLTMLSCPCFNSLAGEGLHELAINAFLGWKVKGKKFPPQV